MMKRKITNIISQTTLTFLKGSVCIAFILIFFSCDENELLKEKPLDFYSPENSFVTYEDFNAATSHLYASYRDLFKTNGDGTFSAPRLLWVGTDLAATLSGFGDVPNFASNFVPTNNFIYRAVWQPCYKIIYDANVIIGRVEGEQSQLTNEQKTLIKAEALFFRAYMYRMLAHIYGGVPIVLEETIKPKRDYVRATRDEVYEQCKKDLLFAAENLKNIDETNDSRISNLVAYHVLSEIYISLRQWDQAIEAANKVINNPSMALMKYRFGSRLKDVIKPNFPWASGGDVYWDLFRKGNQDRSAGNKEALWVLQFEYNVPGGGVAYNGGGPIWEIIFNPRLWTVILKNKDGKNQTITPQPNTYYGGRSGGFIRLTNYFYQDLWKKSGFSQDIRNASHNIIRDFKVNNPLSDYNGKWIIKDKLPISLRTFVDTTRNFFPLLAKTSSMGDHPKDLWIEDQTVEGSITSVQGPSTVCYRDEYEIRMAETYLLRAEAYLGKNDKINAAKDVNEIRRRANALEVNSSEVDIDLILDERLRELNVEELRMVTLTRLGKLVERARKYHPYGNTWADHNNLWPIPYSEIEKNIEGVLEQNPGY
jgi:hypothetical protein